MDNEKFKNVIDKFDDLADFVGDTHDSVVAITSIDLGIVGELATQAVVSKGLTNDFILLGLGVVAMVIMFIIFKK